MCRGGPPAARPLRSASLVTPPALTAAVRPLAARSGWARGRRRTTAFEPKPNRSRRRPGGSIGRRRAWSSAWRNFVVSTVHPPSIPADRAHGMPMRCDWCRRRQRRPHLPARTALVSSQVHRCGPTHDAANGRALRRSRHESESTSVRRCAAHDGAPGHHGIWGPVGSALPAMSG